MPPKAKVTKTDLIKAAAELIRKEGEEALNARAVAALLGVSTQPVFSNYKTMQELRLDAMDYVRECFDRYVQESMKETKYPPYKASGMAYVRFAAEEKEWFKLLFMRNREGENPGFQSESDLKILKLIQKNTGLSREEAELLHFEMWVCVHGL